MTERERDKTDVAWPEWMLRYVGSDNQEAMEDLIWSVGGSPPYGGVSYEEAAAVYELLEEYRGSGAASAEAYAQVESFVASEPIRRMAIEIFRCADEIQNAPDSYRRAPVERGLALARKAGHRGAEASFLAFDSGFHYRAGDVSAARDRTIEALEMFLAVADEDPVYEMRVKQTAQNAISLTSIGGDLDAARALLHKLAGVIDPAVAEQLRRSLDAPR